MKTKADINYTSEYHMISLVIDITFVCFWYALIALLSIKYSFLTYAYEIDN